MKIYIVIFFAILLFQGCYYDKEDLLYPSTTVDCNTINAKFTDVKPVILSKCANAGCHNSSSAAGGVVLETYAQISSKKDRVMQRAIREKTMPPAAALTVSEINSITCWINSGGLNN
jgi:uncharacterized membrane protein